MFHRSGGIATYLNIRLFPTPQRALLRENAAITYSNHFTICLFNTGCTLFQFIRNEPLKHPITGIRVAYIRTLVVVILFNIIVTLLIITHIGPRVIGNRVRLTTILLFTFAVIGTLTIWDL